MPRLLEILDELEAAIPEMRDALGGNEDYMAEDGDEGELPPPDLEAMLPGAEEEEEVVEGEDDLMAPPPFPKKKKSLPKGLV